MARARNIKPGFFKNELLVEQPAFIRLLFIGLWTLADREGRIEDRPKRIKLELFPYDADDVDAGLTVLGEAGFIDRYQSNGVKVIQVRNFLKHQTPHGTEKDSELPAHDGSITVHERDQKGYVTGSKRTNNVNSLKNNVAPTLPNVALPVNNSATPVSSLDNNTLNPDSLNADSLNPDSPNPELVATGPSTQSDQDWCDDDGGQWSAEQDACDPPRSVVVRKPAKPREPSKSSAAWDAYSSAYFDRYGSEPVRNATVNSQMANFVGRIPAEEAPHIAAFYVMHNSRFYVGQMHPVGMLARDAEKLRTEWITNRQVTMTQAHQADKTQANYGVFQKLMDEGVDHGQ